MGDICLTQLPRMASLEREELIQGQLPNPSREHQDEDEPLDALDAPSSPLIPDLPIEAFGLPEMKEYYDALAAERNDPVFKAALKRAREQDPERMGSEESDRFKRPRVSPEENGRLLDEYAQKVDLIHAKYPNGFHGPRREPCARLGGFFEYPFPVSSQYGNTQRHPGPRMHDDQGDYPPVPEEPRATDNNHVTEVEHNVLLLKQEDGEDADMDTNKEYIPEAESPPYSPRPENLTRTNSDRKHTLSWYTILDPRMYAEIWIAWFEYDMATYDTGIFHGLNLLALMIEDLRVFHQRVIRERELAAFLAQVEADEDSDIKQDPEIKEDPEFEPSHTEFLALLAAQAEPLIKEDPLFKQDSEIKPEHAEFLALLAAQAARLAPAIKEDPEIKREPVVEQALAIKPDPDTNQDPGIKQDPGSKHDPDLKQESEIKREPRDDTLACPCPRPDMRPWVI